MRRRVKRFWVIRLICLWALLSVALLGLGGRRVTANAARLYLINACPTPKSDVKFPAALQRLDAAGAGLKLVRMLAGADEGSAFVQCNPEARVVVVGAPHYSPERVSVVQMNAPQVPMSFDVKFPPELSVIEAHLFAVPGRSIQYGVFVAGMGAKVNRLLGVDLTSAKQQDLPWDIYQHTLVAGWPGGVGTTSDIFEVFPLSDGSLTIRKGGTIIQTPWRLPRSVVFPPKDLVFVYVNNSDFLALRSTSSIVEAADGLGAIAFHFLDKTTQKWHIATFPGSLSKAVTGFGPWFAGLVQGPRRKAESPGIEQRRQTITSTGYPLDWFLRDARLFRPGVLFLYNVHTKRQYTIQTDQGDSEIVLVDGGSVYYRVNRSIYRASIGATSLGSAELLVEADVVQDIHWAFLEPR